MFRNKISSVKISLKLLSFVRKHRNEKFGVSSLLLFCAWKLEVGLENQGKSFGKSRLLRMRSSVSRFLSSFFSNDGRWGGEEKERWKKKFDSLPVVVLFSSRFGFGIPFALSDLPELKFVFELTVELFEPLYTTYSSRILSKSILDHIQLPSAR